MRITVTWSTWGHLGPPGVPPGVPPGCLMGRQGCARTVPGPHQGCAKTVPRLRQDCAKTAWSTSGARPKIRVPCETCLEHEASNEASNETSNDAQPQPSSAPAQPALPRGLHLLKNCGSHNCNLHFWKKSILSLNVYFS